MSIDSVAGVTASTSVTRSLYTQAKTDIQAFAAALHQNDLFGAQRALQNMTKDYPDGAQAPSVHSLSAPSGRVASSTLRPSFPSLQSLLEAVQNGDLGGAKQMLAELEKTQGVQGWGSLVQTSVQPDSSPSAASVGGAPGHALDTSA